MVRVWFVALICTVGLAQAVPAQGRFTVVSGPAVALLGCDAAGPGEPTVDFVQVSDGFVGLRVIGVDDFEGESCAEALSALLGSGFHLVTSRTVQRTATRETLVYDLLAR
jgi:hypothetical protein